MIALALLNVSHPLTSGQRSTEDRLLAVTVDGTTREEWFSPGRAAMALARYSTDDQRVHVVDVSLRKEAS